MSEHDEIIEQHERLVAQLMKDIADLTASNEQYKDLHAGLSAAYESRGDELERSHMECMQLRRQLSKHHRISVGKTDKKTCAHCEFFNLEGSYLFTTHRQNGKVYSEHVVNGSTCSVEGYEVACKESGFICREFRPT